MYRDIAEIRQFYHSPLGVLTAKTLARTIESAWPDFLSLEANCVGVGYAIPYLNETSPHLAVMSATQGVVRWPSKGPNKTVLTADHVLPFADNGLDRLLFVHAIENADYLRELMSDAWRVLAPNGRMMIIVPNRRGLWSRVDKTPFGHGRPYTMKQMRNLLREANFVVENHTRALYFFPNHNPVLRMLAPFMEKAGRKIMPKFGGVILIEASKKLYNVTAIPVAQTAQPGKAWNAEPLPT
jgi:SAM-dependent methyltransferase